MACAYQRDQRWVHHEGVMTTAWKKYWKWVTVWKLLTMCIWLILIVPYTKNEQIEMKRGWDFNHFYKNSFLRSLFFYYFMFILYIVLKSKHCPNAVSWHQILPWKRYKAQKFLKTFACSFSMWSDVSSFLGLIFWDLPELERSVSSALLLGMFLFHGDKAPVFSFSAWKAPDFSLIIWVTAILQGGCFYGWLCFLLFLFVLHVKRWMDRIQRLKEVYQFCNYI